MLNIEEGKLEKWHAVSSGDLKMMGRPVPSAGKVVGIVTTGARIIVAMEYGVYEVINGVLVRIKFDGEGVSV